MAAGAPGGPGGGMGPSESPWRAVLKAGRNASLRVFKDF
jgi:hypothetical protein